MKTQEVVAVKVIKNKTAYFNQSMMEVSVLDLVRFLCQRFELLLMFLSSTTNTIRMMITTYSG